MNLNAQVKLDPQSTKSKIADALVAIVQGMDEFNYVKFDEVRLYTSDFKEWELPAAQFIDVAEQIEHQKLEAQRTWSITLEIIHKPTMGDLVSQKTMWNLEYRVSRAIWKNPNLGVKGVINARYTSNETDLHLLKPFYLLRMNFDVVYLEPLVREC